MSNKTTLASVLALVLVAAASAQERAIETCSSGEPTTQRGLPDEDADGIADAIDNCVRFGNASQRDTDGDGFGNRCDGDLNNDGVVNVVDLSLLRASFFADDPGPDADLDGDGAVAVSDLAIMRQLFFQPPGPTGACIRDPSACSGPVQFEASDNGNAPAGNLFVIRTTDPATIYHAGRLLSGSSRCNRAVAGYTFLGTQTWNPNWGFHIDGDVYFHGDSINTSVGCNKTATYVEANLSSWCNIDTRSTACQFWCPWTSVLTRIVPISNESE